MKSKCFFLILSIFLFCDVAFAKHLNKENYYQKLWCDSNGGQMEVVLDDGARVDCLTKDYAIEFDFAQKWAESIGQSLYYSIKTNKKPAVVLIMENPKKEKQYYNRLFEVAKKYGITVFTIKK